MFKKVWTIGLNGVRKWVNNPRYIILFLLLFLFCYQQFSQLNSFSKTMNTRINPLVFPFFANTIPMQIVIMLGIIMLFCDAPFMDNQQCYLIIRSKRKAWVMGQVLYIYIASFIYFALIILWSVIILLPNATLATDGFGKVINTLAYTNASSKINIFFTIDPVIVIRYSPFSALCLNFFLQWTNGVLIGLILFIININYKRMLGVCVGGAVVLWDITVYNFLPIKMRYFSPVTFARLSMVDVTGISGPTPLYTICFMIIAIVLLSFIAVASIKNKSIEVLPEI